MNRVYGGAEGEMITYKFRLYLTEEQEENLMFILDVGGFTTSYFQYGAVVSIYLQDMRCRLCFQS